MSKIKLFFISSEIEKCSQFTWLLRRRVLQPIWPIFNTNLCARTCSVSATFEVNNFNFRGQESVYNRHNPKGQSDKHVLIDSEFDADQG